MSPIFTANLGGRELACTGVLIDCVREQHIPNSDDRNSWDAFCKFIVGRSHSVLGTWPVHVIPNETVGSGDTRFTGYRVHAKFVSFCPDRPSTIEYGILVWHESAITVVVAPPENVSINWSAFAEAMEA